MDLDRLYTILCIVIAIGTIAGVVWKVREPARQCVTACRAIANLPRDVAASRQEIAAVSIIVNKELTANGGGSMRDIVNRLATRFDVGDARQRALVTQLEIAMWESDERGQCVYVSREMCRITGRTQEESLGRGWIGTIHPSDRERVVEDWDACVRDGRDFSMQHAFMTPDGERVEVFAAATVCRDANGQMVGYVGSVELLGERS